MTTPCRPLITDAGLPWRTGPILQREGRLLPGMIMVLRDRPKADPSGAEQHLTVELIQSGFDRPEGRFLGAAGFLAGRVQPVDSPGSVGLLTDLCHGVLTDRPVAELGSRAWGYVEAAMALALHDDREIAHHALRGITQGGGANSSYDHLAAFYLAQLGDPSGWPVLLAALHSGDPVTSRDAGRLLLGFAPYDGERVGEDKVDVRAALKTLSKDRSFREEIPDLVAEIDEAQAKS